MHHELAFFGLARIGKSDDGKWTVQTHSALGHGLSNLYFAITGSHRTYDAKQVTFDSRPSNFAILALIFNKLW